MKRKLNQFQINQIIDQDPNMENEWLSINAHL